ncbi:traU family protein [Orientia tsutsugamushi str. Kato PP]|uniref:Conjugative transfer protein n=2 Tax=Orientia tsutsugamushi TaxID=784 RepID=A0A2U3QUE5_ORITS|nr:traU family protein [Orientia tsutsugamushi str. Kato PP]SPR04572.1 conjugative transfer protein [Orientia tsutsugamushi]
MSLSKTRNSNTCTWYSGRILGTSTPCRRYKVTNVYGKSWRFVIGSATQKGRADCMSCSTGLLASDYAFWCAECQEMLYPFTGTAVAHNGGVGTSVLMVSKFMARMHRQLMLWGYYGYKGLCGKYPMPVMKKSQYRLQMTYPIPETKSCKSIGQTEATWQAGREFPVNGEDFCYLILRKDEDLTYHSRNQLSIESVTVLFQA